MSAKLVKIMGLLLAAVLLGGLFPLSAVASDGETYVSNVIGPLEVEEEGNFGEPDLSADLESEEDFVASLKNVKLKGLPYNKKLTAVAETQLGYSESESNFIVKEYETGKKEKAGYTRYGAWYGHGFEYEDWCAMFISFCLYYTKVPAELMPLDSGVITWMHKLQNMDLFRSGREYLPKSGDLVFFDYNLDGQGDHVGIVNCVFVENDVEMIETIEGNHTCTVEKFTYPRQSLEIMGYGVMSSEVPEDEQETQIFTDFLSVDGSTYRVSMTYMPDAQIPENAEIRVCEILPGTEEYAAYVAETEGVLGMDEGSADDAKVLDICILADGVEIQPAAPINVEVTLLDQGAEAWNVVHFSEEEAPQVLENTSEGDVVTFETEGFSIFVFTKAVIEKTLDASDGNTYKITVTYDSSAGIPDGAQLAVSEITHDEDDYLDYLDKAAAALEIVDLSYVKLFDLSITDQNDLAVHYQPQTPVEVSVQLLDAEDSTSDFSVVHFDTQPEVLEASTSGDVVSFTTDGFSAYAIVAGPAEGISDNSILKTLSDVADAATYERLYLSIYRSNNEEYFTSRSKNDEVLEVSTSINQAGKWIFEPSGDENAYRIRTEDGHYIRQKEVNRNDIVLTDDGDLASVFILGQPEKNSGRFTIKLSTENRWLQYSGSGKGIRLYQDITNMENSRVQISLVNPPEIENDPYDLDGKTYSLLTWDGGKTGKALTGDANENYEGNFCADFLTVMTKTGDADDKLYVPNNTADTLTSWTFTWKRDDIYTLSTEIGGGTKYLKIDSNGLSLVSADEAGEIQLIPGTGIHKGQLILKSGNTVLTYSGEFARGFNTDAGTGKEYLYLAVPKDESSLDDYYRTYSATKISVSDPTLAPASPDAEPKKIIIYTRVWNGSSYTYLAVNGEGKLVPCYESGDSIEWIGSTLDELQWEFTEYGEWREDGEGNKVFTPNHYYELQNAYTKKYLAPLQEGQNGKPPQILSDNTIGLNMSGRRNGQYYTPVLAWDEDNYAFTSIKVDLDAGAGAVIEPCLSRDGLDFYFASVADVPVDDALHTVSTVDNNQFGISMKLVNFDTRKEMSSFLGNDSGGLTTKLVQGLLSTSLDREDGYPTAVQGSLRSLFSGAQEVNYLFADSTFRATGYYEYDSAENFAHLIKSDNDPWIGQESPNGGIYKKGDFVVYQELGSYDSGGDKYTLKHGQFFPFNDLKPGLFAEKNGRNLYTPTGAKLDESNPRYNEQLYLIENTDCHFGMELTARFDQTPNGLDAWGHDIIFEFSGDDDFWLYVDGELIIDLGGIHSAVPGSVNFRTGVVNVNGTSTTLYQLFHDNYKKRGMSEEEITKKLLGVPTDPETYPGIFTGVNGVFKDNTSHTMRIFYMERGAGASNLHMRFNLAAVKKGTVQLSKKLSNVEDSDSTATAYPYQIWYKNPVSGEYERLTESNMGGTSGGSVKYKGSVNDVEYKSDYLVDHIKDGVTYRVKYKDVFLLPAGETAEITFPTFGTTGEEVFVTDYSITECGVDPDIYQGVSIEGNEITGSPKMTEVKIENGQEVTLDQETESGLLDYAIEYSTLTNRPRVSYTNEVKETKALTIQKELYKNENGVRQRIELYDANGDPIDPNNPDLERVFEFRLSLKASNSAPEAWEKKIIIYHVKDPKGCYCIWNRDLGKLVSTGKSDFADLTEDKIVDGVTVLGEKTLGSFQSSESGAMSNIPAYYTVEVRGLIPGTEYQVVERPDETPDGYRFWQYKAGSVETAEGYDPWNGIKGTVTSDENGNKVLVRNDKGYELQLEKIWADESTIQSRDSSYFAVFYEIKDAETGVVRTLVDDSVKQLSYNSDPQLLKWWYWKLPEVRNVENPIFSQYKVYEIKGSFIVNEQGEVTDSQNVEPILNGGILTLNGTPVGGSESPIVYRVTYDDPKMVGDNVRKYEVTNTPSEIPAVKFLKKDWSGNPLPDAEFTLTLGDNKVFENKPSADSGLISIEHLSKDAEYILEETKAPNGYYGLQKPLTIRLVSDISSGWTLIVTPEDDDIKDFYEVGYETETDPETHEPTGMEYVTLTIKNRPYDLKAIKTDETNSPIEGVLFNLYRQITVGTSSDWKIVDWEGISVLMTDKDGVIPHLDNILPAGTYQLREIEAASGYSQLGGNIDFTISQMGVITLDHSPDGVKLESIVDPEDENGTITCKITIPNRKNISFLKVNSNTENPLAGACFDLYRIVNDVRETPAMYTELISGSNGLLSTAENVSEFDLPTGTYHLVETSAPSGFVIMAAPVVITVTAENGITATMGNASLPVKSPYEEESAVAVWTVVLPNIPGVELPKTGGPGTAVWTAVGLMFSCSAGAIQLIFRRKRRT